MNNTDCFRCGGSGSYQLSHEGVTEEVSCTCWQSVIVYPRVDRKDGKDWAIELIRKQFGEKAILKGENERTH